MVGMSVCITFHLLEEQHTQLEYELHKVSEYIHLFVLPLGSAISRGCSSAKNSGNKKFLALSCHMKQEDFSSFKFNSLASSSGGGGGWLLSEVDFVAELYII